MREISFNEIKDTVQSMTMMAAYHLPEDVRTALVRALNDERSDTSREALKAIIRNAQIAAEGEYPLCQDTGTAVLFVEIGQDVHITGGSFKDAVNQGVKEAYETGYLRKSIVEKPYSLRVNTTDNTPAIIHSEIVPGSKIKLSFMAKGGGSENMSRLFMLKPADGREAIIAAVVQAVVEAGGSPCPPLVIGVGVGGNAETAMMLSKKALLRKLGTFSEDREDASLEKDILQAVNDSGVGALGFGGNVTAMGVSVLSVPCHMASLPLGINLGCHATRHMEVTL